MDHGKGVAGIRGGQESGSNRRMNVVYHKKGGKRQRRTRQFVSIQMLQNGKQENNKEKNKTRKEKKEKEEEEREV